MVAKNIVYLINIFDIDINQGTTIVFPNMNKFFHLNLIQRSQYLNVQVLLECRYYSREGLI